MLLLPVFLLKPCATPPTRDLIPTWGQDVSLQLQLDAFSYQDPTINTLDMYTITQRGRILKLGRKLTLEEVLRQAATAADGKPDGLPLVGDWCLELYAVPKGDKGKEWVDEMKRDLKAKGLRS